MSGEPAPTAAQAVVCPSDHYCNYIKCTGNDDQANEIVKRFTNCSVDKLTYLDVQAFINNTDIGAENCTNFTFKRH